MLKYLKIYSDIAYITAQDDPQFILSDEELTEKEACEESLYCFIQKSWSAVEPIDFRDGWHIQAIAEHLEALYYKDIVDLIINQPFRTGKSIVCSVLFPAWALMKDPKQSFLYTSYSHRFAERDSRKCLKLVQSDWYQRKWGQSVIIPPRYANAQKFETAAGGYRMISSVGGSSTGGGANFSVTDDPNNVAKVDSEAIRENTNFWWDNVMSSRYNLLEDRRRLIVQQRAHSMDLSGYTLAKDDPNWIHLSLPMEFEISRRCSTIVLPGTNGKLWKDPRKKEGELLWPAGVNAKQLERMKKVDFRGDSYVISGQLQQRPSPMGGGILQRDWFKVWKERDFPEFEYVLQSWDTALTTGPKACFSACSTWGVFKDKGGIFNIMLLSLYKDKVEYPDLRKMAVRLANNYEDVIPDDPLKHRNPPDLVLIEHKVSGYSLLSDLMRANIPVMKFEPNKHGDKIGRVRMISHLIENGLVWLPTVPPKCQFLTEDAQMFLEAAGMFPNDVSNDVIDSMSQAFIRLTASGWLVNKEDPREFVDETAKWHKRPYW